MLAIYLFFLLIVLVCGCKKAEKGTFHEDFLSYKVVKGLQGFAALAVILHHVTQEVTQYGRYDKGIINVFVDAGVLFTGMFFFFSGYGLIVSLMQKEDYLKDFMKKHYKWLLPAGIVLFIALHIATTWMLSHVGYWLEYPGHKGYWEKLATFLVQCPMVIVFVLTLMLISMKIQFKNKLLDFLGVIALEMYLLQNIFITKLTHVIDNDILFFAAVYAGTIVLAYVVHKLNQRLIVI